MTTLIYDTARLIIHFIEQNQIWAIPLVFFLAFCESLAFISLLIPATIILIGVGTIVGAGALSFTPIFLSSACGAFFGDLVSYLLGKHYHTKILTMWPLSRHPRLINKGKKFFLKHGTFGVFVGRFFGPLRAIVPLIAGTMSMPSFAFFIANVTSAFVWAFVILAPGTFGIHWLAEVFG